MVTRTYMAVDKYLPSDSSFSGCEVGLASTKVTSEAIAGLVFGSLFVVVERLPLGSRCVFFWSAAWNIATS